LEHEVVVTQLDVAEQYALPIKLQVAGDATTQVPLAAPLPTVLLARHELQSLLATHVGETVFEVDVQPVPDSGSILHVLQNIDVIAAHVVAVGAEHIDVRVSSPTVVPQVAQSPVHDVVIPSHKYGAVTGVHVARNSVRS